MKNLILSLLLLSTANAAIAQEYIYDTLQIGYIDSIVVSTTQLSLPIVSATNNCTSNGNANFVIVDEGEVLEIEAIQIGQDTACIEVCDNLGACETTYFYITCIPNLCDQDPTIASIGVYDATCDNMIGGTVAIEMIDPTVDYYFYWPGIGIQGNVVTGLAPGTYQFYAYYVDNGDCFTEGSVTVGLYDNFEAIIDTIYNATCFSANGGVELLPEDAIFQWHDGHVGRIRNDLESGVYQVTATLDNCFDILEIEIGEDAAEGTFVLEQDTIYRCYNTGATLDFSFTPSPGFVGPATLVINDGNGNVWENGFLGNEISGSTVYYTISAYDYNGCLAGEASFIVMTTEGTANASLAVGNEYCDSLGAIYIGFVSNYPPYTYQWADLNDPLDHGFRDDLVAGDYSFTVIDQIGCEFSFPNPTTINNDCELFKPAIGIWPGDTDSSQIVDVEDLLNIGLAFGSTGTTRINASIEWLEQEAYSWPVASMNYPTNVNYRNIDCNGDGIINEQDTLAIAQNMGLETVGFQDDGEEKVDGKLRAVFDHIDSDGWVYINLLLGEENSPVEHFYGLYFALNMEASILEAGSQSFTLNNSWLAESTANVLLMQRAVENQLQLAISRKDHKNRDGFGMIGTFKFKLAAGQTLPDELQVELLNGKIISAQGASEALSISESLIPTPISELVQISGLQIFPNPVDDLLLIRGERNLELKSIQLSDSSGKTLWQKRTTGNQINLPTGRLSNGIYYLTISTPQGLIREKIIVLH